MSGVKGRSGKKLDKEWRNALRAVLHRPDADNRKPLALIAEACVAKAMSGDMDAIIEIGNRLDGRPKQEMDLTTSPGEAFLEFLREMNDRNREPPALGPSVLEQLPKPEAVRH